MTDLLNRTINPVQMQSTPYSPVQRQRPFAPVQLDPTDPINIPIIQAREIFRYALSIGDPALAKSAQQQLYRALDRKREARPTATNKITLSAQTTRKGGNK